MLRILAVIVAIATSAAPATSQEAPAGIILPCVKTGAVSVFFNGKPALKLGDVAACPPAMYEIIPNIVIEGQPMVHLTGCTAHSPNVSAAGKSTNSLGDCQQ